MTRLFRWLPIATLLVYVCCLPGVVNAQSGANSGQIVGQVLDPSGAAVPAARVTVLNKETNYTREVVTDSAGRYAVPLVLLGRYELTTTANGFDAESQEVLVTLGSTITANFHLTLGARAEAVHVSAAALTLEPTQAPSKSILTALQIQHLPSNGGRLQSLIWQMPGGQIEPEFPMASEPVSVSYTNLDQQNLRNTPAAQALLAVAPEQTVDAFSDAQSVIGRLDHILSERARAFTRVDFSHTRATSVAGSNGLSTGPSISTLTTSALSNQTIADVWSGTALFQLTSTFSTNRLNELRVDFGREERPRAAQGTGAQVTVQNAGATIATYGPQGTGISFGNGQFPSRDNRYQLADNFSIVNGAHTAKLGVDFVHIASDVTFAPGSNGVYTFSSLANFTAR